MIDLHGVPEFYASELGAVENAGGGNIRMIRGVKRGDVFVPIFSCVMPAIKMLEIGPIMRAFATQVASETDEVRAH